MFRKLFSYIYKLFFIGIEFVKLITLISLIWISLILLLLNKLIQKLCIFSSQSRIFLYFDLNPSKVFISLKVNGI